MRNEHHSAAGNASVTDSGVSINEAPAEMVRPEIAPSVKGFRRDIYQGGSRPLVANPLSIMYEMPRTVAIMNEPGPLGIVTAGQASKQGVTLHMYRSDADSYAAGVAATTQKGLFAATTQTAVSAASQQNGDCQATRPDPAADAHTAKPS